MTDYSKHTDEQLREGIERVDEQLGRIASEDSEQAVQAAREQREAMAEELARRLEQRWDAPTGETR
jgi:ribosome-binding protein aMBF1 (putative translation factor)